ncbi:unnamed protein product [Rhodiola kirilowii]
MAKRLNYSPETSRIEQLPDDLLLLILASLSNLGEIARTSILSRRWKNVWHNITCLDFDATTVLSVKKLRKCQAWWYIAWVNKVIDTRVGFPSVKELRIQYKLDVTQGPHIDRWINFAIANPVETLYLEFGGYIGIISQNHQYKLSEESWYKAPSGLSNIKCLKSLHLSSVNVSKQFIEFVISSCPLLEDLSLHNSGSYKDLDVSGVPPLRLRHLKINAAEDFALTTLCAPYLTTFYYNAHSRKFNPQKIDVPLLTELAVSSNYGSQRIMKYLEHFWSYLPQLEKLELIMFKPQRFMVKPMPEMFKLKYLMIRANWDTDPIFHRIIKFINACPLLETFAFEIVNKEEIPSPMSIQRHGRKERKVEKSCFKNLKVLELYGVDGITIDQVVVKCIVSKAPILEKLTVDIREVCRFPIFLSSKPEIVEVVEAKAKELCKGRPIEIEIKDVVG